MDRRIVILLTIVVGILTGPIIAAQLSRYLATGMQQPRQPAPMASDGEDTADVALLDPPLLPPAMTRNQFFQIQSGMALAQCLAIVGAEGEPVDASKLGVSGTTAAFRWQEPSGPNEFTLGFRDGLLVSKGMDMSSAARKKARARSRAQKALEKPIDQTEVRQLEEAAQRTGQPVVITLAEFNQLQPGMTYDQCVAVIGAEHPMARGYAAQRDAILSGQVSGRQTLSEGYCWQNPAGYFAEIAFENGRMTSKEWRKTTGQARGGRASGSSGNFRP